MVYSHALCLLDFQVLTGNIPFHLIDGWAAITGIVRGARPDIPANAPTATRGLWKIVQRCWGEEPTERPPLSEIRQELCVAAEEWDTGPGVSGSTDSYVKVAQDTLSSSGESSDTGAQIHFSVRLYLCSRPARE